MFGRKMLLPIDTSVGKENDFSSLVIQKGELKNMSRFKNVTQVSERRIKNMVKHGQERGEVEGRKRPVLYFNY